MTAEEAAAHWQRCKPWIEAALAHSPGLETIEDVEARIASEQYQFWPALRSAIITEIVEFPRKRVLMVQHMGGNMDELKAMRASIETFARANDCVAVAGCGRAGWKRVFASDGYRVGFVAYIKDLA